MFFAYCKCNEIAQTEGVLEWFARLAACEAVQVQCSGV